MSSRFHNKWHRHNHHTLPLDDPRYPDASHDPIASPEHPFRGDFILQGMLSASNGIMLQAPLTGEVVFDSSLYYASMSTPVTASGDFLKVTIGSVERLVRLWSY